MSHEADGERVEGVVEMGERADVLFGLGDTAKDGMAVRTVGLGEGFPFRPAERLLALVVGTLGCRFHGLFIGQVGGAKSGIFFEAFGDELSGFPIAFFKPAHRFVSTNLRMPEGAEKVPGFSNFSGRDAGNRVEAGVGKFDLQTAHREFDEVARLGESAFGEALFFFFEGCDFEQRFADLLAFLVIIVSFDFELCDEAEKLLLGLDREFFAVGDRFRRFVEDELAGSSVAFPTIDFRPGEDESVQRVCFAF